MESPSMEVLGIPWRFLGIPRATRSFLGFYEETRGQGGPGRSQEHPRRSQDVLGSSQELLGSPRKLLGKSYKKLQNVTEVTKCISDVEFEHPAFLGVNGGTRASQEPVQEWASDLIEEDQGRVKSAKSVKVSKSYEELQSSCMHL